MEPVFIPNKGRMKRKMAHCAMGIFLSAAMVFNILWDSGLAVRASEGNAIADAALEDCKGNALDETVDNGNAYRAGADTELLTYRANTSLAAAGSGEIKVDSNGVFAQGTPICYSAKCYRYGDTMTVTMKLVDPSYQGIPDAAMEVRSGPNDLQTIASATTGQDGGVTFTLPVDDHL